MLLRDCLCGHPGDRVVDDAGAVVGGEAGFAERILISSSATGVAFGHQTTDVAFSHVLTSFSPALEAAGLPPDVLRDILAGNPAALLSVR